MPALTGARCHSMLRDRDHLFHAMWGATPWTTQSCSSCFEASRDANLSRADVSVFLDGVRSGLYCSSNWLVVNRPSPQQALPPQLKHLRDIGRPRFHPTYTESAPAVLGFDWSVHQHCRSQLNTTVPYTDFAHAAACVAASRNILWLKDENGGVPYNLCRNLEWLACACAGALPGQRSPTLLFATPVLGLDTEGAVPLDGCRTAASGNHTRQSRAHPQRCPLGTRSYTSQDVYFLEVCLIHQLCSNGDDMFKAELGAASPGTSSLPLWAWHRPR